VTRALKIRLALLLLILFSLICYSLEPDVISRYHAMRLRFLGAEVTYGFKPGWLVSISSSSISASEFLKNGRRHLDSLSRDRNLHLYLSRTDVTDSDLPMLKEISGSIYLDVSGTAVSDAGLNHLLDIKHFNGVGVVDSKVTERGYREFSAKRGWVLPEDISDWISSKGKDDSSGPVVTPESR